MNQKFSNQICRFAWESWKSDGTGKHFNEATMTKAYEPAAMLAVCLIL